MERGPLAYQLIGQSRDRTGDTWIFSEDHFPKFQQENTIFQMLWCAKWCADSAGTVRAHVTISSMSALELTPFQKRIADLLLTTPAPGKNAGRNAIRHIQKAWAIKDIDREMAVFRAITGQEESATAIFHALQRRRYAGAKKLNRWKHSHKWSVTPFFEAVEHVLANSANELHPRLEIMRYQKKEQVRVSIDTPDPRFRGYPVPPLNIEMQVNGKVHDYSTELATIAQRKNFSNIKKYIDDLANRRNQVLYANEQGIPTIEHALDKHLAMRRDNIFRNLAIYLMIDPHPEKQIFVQRCLDAFLTMLELVPPDQVPTTS